MSHCHSHNNKKEFEHFLEKLTKHGLRITQQRTALAKTILGFSGPFSADQLLQSLQEHSIDLATIYRSLTKFCEMGLISSVDFGDGTSRFEYIFEEDHHHHVICTSCKAVEPIRSCTIQVQEQIIEHMGYKNVSHRLEFFGMCKNCR